MPDVIEQIYQNNKIELIADEEGYKYIKDIYSRINNITDKNDIDLRNKQREEIMNSVYELVEYVDKRAFKKALRLGSEFIHYTLFDDSDK